MQAVFYGVGAVIGIIAVSAYKLTTKSIGKDRLWAIYLVGALVTILTESEGCCYFWLLACWCGSSERPENGSAPTVCTP